MTRRRVVHSLVMLAALLATACSAVPDDKASPHVVYMLDSSGDCMAIGGYDTPNRPDTVARKAWVQHVSVALCAKAVRP